MSNMEAPAPIVETIPGGSAEKDAAKVEAPVIEAPKTEKPLSASLIALAKKEKMYRKLREESKSYESKLQAKEREIADRESRLKQFDNIQNPIEALRLKGWSYEDATNFVLNNQQPTAEMQIQHTQKQVQDWIRAQEQQKQLEAQRLTAQAQQEQKEVIGNFKNEINAFLSSNKDEYELTEFNEAQELVYDTIEAHFAQTKKIMSIKEASDLVEKFLEEQSDKLTQTKKVQAKLGKKQETQQKEQLPQGFQSKTLTNSVSSAVPSMLPARTEQDRLQRALAVLNK